MVDLGLDAYRFSISWSRVIPNGRGSINQKGVEYYNNLINELTSNGIQPHATLVHWDHPQALQDAYGGWINQQIVRDFTTFADVCFKEFGDRVLYWTTINEPNFLAPFFYNSSQYIAAHHLLLGHASVVNLYREKYQATQNGSIGLNVYTSWFIPEKSTQEDLDATERVANFHIGWFVHPLIFGDYPDIMKQSLGRRLPSFTEHETKLMNGSFDFIGVNCYTASVVTDDPGKDGIAANYTAKDVGGVFVQGVLEYFKRVYGNPPIYIHENGFRTFRNASLDDTSRIHYLNASMGSLLAATRNGSNVRGYFQWSFLDVFETDGGYTYGFGFYYVDFNNQDLERSPKRSAHWYSTFLKGQRSRHNGIIHQMNNSTFMS
ncbi:cyanidin 3-O-glucoside 5-O-glucosyltransferase (acyl-glucose)-like [Beta vulgaris subsp. vulgaris]|uniref:cyanidin 3-O-glucoside 5-O-glucosyltransferase (acyl-glucose)-like n=1 Tax=Beta vulgaris subsp. vulgaris TaxID=3555 RepID=UPI00254756F4|nr:cyanidin 3-O-glucoside 5-O-glucosyltransferase (acyl-glucose)-like [Beta vulgaris subsp. vulgaris]